MEGRDQWGVGLMEGRKQPPTAPSSLAPPAPTYEGPTEPRAMDAGALCSPTYGCKGSRRAQDLHGPMLWVQDHGQPLWPHIPRTIPIPKHPREQGRGTQGQGGPMVLPCSMPGMRARTQPLLLLLDPEGRKEEARGLPSPSSPSWC